MRGRARIPAFVAALVAVFVGAALLGGATNPRGPAANEGHGGGASEAVPPGHGGGASEAVPPGHGGGASEAARARGSHGAGSGAGAGAGEASPTGGEHGADATASNAHAAPPGLQVAEGGLRLALDRSRLARSGRGRTLEFQIVDAGGKAVRDFALEHTKRMHFIVVRRDLSAFQHLHPKMRSDGTWTTRVNLPAGGVYRVFADFKRADAKRTLGTDLHVAGRYRPKALPRPLTAARTPSGLDVSLRSRAAGTSAGKAGRVEFEVRDGGKVVNDQLQPYLGAKGHLVALRAGDLAYLHTHPDGDALAFSADYPSPGAFRLFVQFRYRDKVHTAAFTQEVRR